jgi:4-amino-4-deoxy-L-arabinose transferase-like glycosyltransferase
MNRKHELAAIAAILGAYLFFSLAWISLPGLQFDELLFTSVWYRHSKSNFYFEQFRILGGNILTMMGSYLGALKGWLWSLVFVLGRSVFTVRIPAVLLGGITLALFYYWVRRWYSRPPALVALLLAATDCVYIITTRMDYGPVALQRLLLMAGILAGTKWALEIKNVARAAAHTATPALRTPHSAFRIHSRLAAAGFCFGLGLWDKATFAWGLMALAATLLVLFPREVLRRLRPFPAAVFLLFFCLGALPFLDYNLRTPGRGTRAMSRWESFDATTWKLKWINFHRGVGGNYVYGLMGGESIDRGESPRMCDDAAQRLLDALGWFTPQQGTLFPWALGATMLVGAAAAWYRQRAVLFPLVLSLAHWIAVLLTREAGGPHHTTLIYPFPHLAVAAAGVWVWQGAARLPVAASWMARRGLALALAAVVLTQLAFNARQLSAYRQVRGARVWTDATYDIAAYLKANRPDLLVNMDWGFGIPLQFLTDDRVLLYSFCRHFEKEEAQIEELRPLVARTNTLFLLHTEPFVVFPSMTTFKKAVAQAGKRVCPVRTFYQGNGEAVALLVQLEPLAFIDINREGVVRWKADRDVLVFVNADGGSDVLMARHPSGSTKPAFLTDDHTYRFAMKEVEDNRAGQVLDLVYWRKDKSGRVWVGKHAPGQQ